MLAPITKDDKVQGFVVLDPTLIKDYVPVDHFTIDNLHNLEVYAADLKWLFKDLENHIAVMNTDIPQNTLKSKFQQAGVHLEELCIVNGDQVYGSAQLEQLLMAGLVMDMNPF